MIPQRLTAVDDDRLRTLERDVIALSNLDPAGVADPGVRQYLDVLPPRAAAELIERMAQMRHALDRASSALERAGFTLEAYCALNETERRSAAWQAVREAWEAVGQSPMYLVRFARRAPEAYASREAAMEAAIEALETCAGYPVAIETEDGKKLMSCAEILQVWEDRHDPG